MLSSSTGKEKRGARIARPRFGSGHRTYFFSPACGNGKVLNIERA
jgi:hypothetical protein